MQGNLGTLTWFLLLHHRVVHERKESKAPSGDRKGGGWVGEASPSLAIGPALAVRLRCRPHGWRILHLLGRLAETFVDRINSEAQDA